MEGNVNVSYLIGLSFTQERTQDIVVGDYNVIGGGGGLDATWNIFMGSSIDAGLGSEHACFERLPRDG